MLKKIAKLVFVAAVIAVVSQVALPIAGGVWYAGCGNRYVEQCWLDRAILHLKLIQLRCTDPDLQEVLEYTIQRYNRIGPWDVMVMPLGGPVKDGYKVIGCNAPWCPGITIDPEVLSYSVHDGAMTLVHEALHDYWPYFGHAHVTPRMEKLEAMSWRLR